MRTKTITYINASEIFEALARHPDSTLNAEEISVLFSDACWNVTFGDTDLSLVGPAVFWGVFDSLDCFTPRQLGYAFIRTEKILGPKGMINLSR